MGIKAQTPTSDDSRPAAENVARGAEPAFADNRSVTVAQRALNAMADGSARVLQQRLSFSDTRSGRKTAGPASPAVLQGKDIDLPTHGRIWVPDTMNLEPDDPVFGGTANVGVGRLASKAATSMEALVTPEHPLGSEPKSLDKLFEGLPTKGKYKIPANSKKEKDGSTLYIKGHLLNDNLGGPGSAENLYPITHQANVDHDRKVEEPIKDHVNKEGGAVHYKVTVNKVSEGDTALYTDDSKSSKLKYVNANFVCEVTEFNKDKSSKKHNITINSVWGGTDNSSKSGLKLLKDGQHGKASTFDIGKVKIMPRAQAKEEWDKRLLLLGQHLAEKVHMEFGNWLIKTVKGIGKAGAGMLNSDKDYGALGSSDKRTMTAAQNALEIFLEENYSLYMQVVGGYDDTPQTVQQNTPPSTGPSQSDVSLDIQDDVGVKDEETTVVSSKDSNDGMGMKDDEAIVGVSVQSQSEEPEAIEIDAVQSQVRFLQDTIGEIEFLTLKFSGLSIDTGAKYSTGKIEVKSPPEEYKGIKVKTMDFTLDFHEDRVNLFSSVQAFDGQASSFHEDFTGQSKKICGSRPPYDKEAQDKIIDMVKWSFES